MDQTTPHYGMYVPDGSYQNRYPEYLPGYMDAEYDSPAQFQGNGDPIYQQINDPCALPESPPDPNVGMLPTVYGGSRHPMSHYPSPMANQLGHPVTQSGAIPVPVKKFTPSHPYHPGMPYPSPAKRLRGSSHSSNMSSPLSTSTVGSFKQEEEIELPYVFNAQPAPQYYNNIRMDAFPTSSVSEESHGNIDFQPIFKEKWTTAFNGKGERVSIVDFRAQADKGFNFSQTDESFICQKKNHFQVTVQIGVSGQPHYLQLIRSDGEPTFEEVKGFCVDLFGVKAEATEQTIKIEQSQSDRSRKPFFPHSLNFAQLQQQFTLGRLHFSETTANNMRKKGKPNPDQRFFRLVIALYAETSSRPGETPRRHLIYSVASDNIIVRASNPGQFESDVATGPAWQRSSHEEDAVFHLGNVGINNEHPEEALDVRGNMRITGRVIQPSDERAKEILEEVDSRKQLDNIRKLRLYRYRYREDAAKALGITGAAIYDTGIIAQEVLETIPEAVEVVGDVVLRDGETIENFLMVNKDRLFMENLGAVKELTMITDSYANRISKLERLKAYLKTRDSFRSYVSTTTAKTAHSSASNFYGVSAPPSARPSIYAISEAHRPSYSPKKSVTPRTLLGPNYVQWLTLALVCVIAVVLIGMMAVWFAKLSNDNDQDGSNGLSHTGAFLVQNVTWIPPRLETTELFTGSVTKPPTVNLNPVIVPANISFWDALFEDSNCSFIVPISMDPKCVFNLTYAALHCKPWDSAKFVDDLDHPACCSALLRENPLPSEMHLFPEYIEEPKPPLPKNLHISFESKNDVVQRVRKPTMNKELKRTELVGGKAALYRFVDPLITHCSPHPVDPETFTWGALKRIVLEEPNVSLGSQHCYSIKQPCGYNQTYTITVPISRYYDLVNITVGFLPKSGMEVISCTYMSQDCYKKLKPASIKHTEQCEKVSLPIAYIPQSELQVRVVPTNLLQEFGDDVCRIEHDSIHKYNLVFSRACR